MVSVSRGFDVAACPRLHLVPSMATSSCTDLPCPASEASFNVQRASDAHLNRAFSRVALSDGTEAASQSQQEPLSQSAAMTVPQRSSSGKRGALVLDLSTLASQEAYTQGTQGFSTPVDQQFLLLDPESSMLVDEDSRSPAPSPKKRHRRVSMQEADSDSQDGLSGLSQSRSQGEPVNATMGAVMGPKTRPPAGPKGKKRNEPTRFAQSEKQQSRLSREYVVENKELGHGHYSIVYRAIHRQCGKAYAIKKSKRPLHSTTDLHAWIEEVKILAAVEGHPNIVTYHDSWAEPSIGGDYQYIKLELCGESLCAHVKAKQALPNGELWEITRQMASALQHVHALGLVHLDVKPDNIMRSLGGAFKLGDFGHATKLDGSRGWTEGDARYLASEMLKASSPGSVPALDKVDMFALGASLYELASGIPLPASGERWAALRSGKAAMLLPACSHQLQSLMKRLMSPDPSARPDATAVLATCDKQKQMGTLPLQPSLPRPNWQSL